nr:MAG TPA: hypothetical protein [Caudoviricetes sp.]
MGCAHNSFLSYRVTPRRMYIRNEKWALVKTTIFIGLLQPTTNQ